MRPYVRPYAWRMVVMVLAALGGVAASIVVPLVTAKVVDGPIAHHDKAGLLPLALLAIGLGVAEAVLIFIRRWVQNTATLGIERRMRDDLYIHLQALPPSFHDQWQSGQLLSRATSDLSAIRRFTGFGVVFLIVNVATFATIIGLLVHKDALLGTLVAVTLLPVIPLCARFERRYRRISRRVQDQQGDVATQVEEAATGLRVIKAFGRRELVAGRFDESARTLRGTQLEQARLRAGFVSFLDLIPNVALALVMLLGAFAVSSGRLTLGGLVAFITLVLQLVWPVEALGFILASAQEAATAAQRVYEVYDTVPAIRDDPQAQPLERARGHVRFEGVTFAFEGSDEPVLAGVDLDVRPGETLAIVGSSGSGKSTLAMLVPRLADVTQGRVTIDGHDVRELTLQSLRSAVATAFEEPILFSASVRENVTLGHPDATDAEVEQALALAQADFVHDLPWGLQTRVGEQGMSLSGGQRQRLALARAVIGRPAVLVLDDPLSALDVETEHLVERALARVLSTTTAIVVVHRPSTVALADRVALLRDGRVQAVGTHSDLMATVPEYADVLGQEEEVRAS
ncbi:ABC transporter ATP-binding protein [Angustibacter luteus]|uniref:ABC transporter ATP-binding protein n=1 Tax=Angustibacter luteus TaxID=658456 RepID=A0ABW1JJ88_9ACTN